MNSRRKIQRASLVRRWQETISRRRGKHDPMLVFNMSILNSTERRAGIFEQFKIHENGT
jgi:hypothetical protein